MGAKPGGTIVVQYPLSGSETIIGSAPTAHLSIPGSTLAPHHARITWVNDRFAIEDMSNGQTWVSFRGDPTQLRQVPINALRNGSLIRLGEERFIFRQPEGANAYLERQMTLPAHGLTIGSAAVCDIIVNGGAAQQARIIRDGQRWVVESLSTGGAYVSFSGDPAQERPVSGRNALKPGSLLRVANTTLRMAE